ncbi:CPBP family intramembrane glutamic endopeptidase [Modestobacter marinus]|uniref:CPBP family intramembrane glutamic endopeptidase n=1 Tax=Modestobacter marinus TaxID=477641 RepID=UPI001C93B730|nr:type II CAAX endopeptidase family protein [Modestobacter marinus]
MNARRVAPDPQQDQAPGAAPAVPGAASAAPGRNRSRNALSRALARHQVTVFVLVTMAVSWVFIPVADGGLLPHGPMLAALLVLAGVSGRRGISGLWAQLSRWRVGCQWHLVAAGIFLVVHGAALAVSAAIGVGMADPGTVLSVGTLVGIWIPLVLLGGQWEEPGWLGYLLRRLRDRVVGPPLLVLLVAGLIRMVWHTPLVLLGTIPWYDYVFGVLALQVILSWLYDRTGGSVLVPMTCHLFANLSMASVLPLVDEPDRGLYWLVLVLVEVAVAGGLLLTTRGRTARRGPTTRAPGR